MTRRALALLLATTGLALLLRVVWLSGQPLLPDDLAVGVTAHNFTRWGWPEPTMWNHPRLRDSLVALSEQAFGRGPWGLKIWSVAIGTLSVPATGLLVWELTGSGVAAVLASFLLAIDPLHLDFSRQAINDVQLAFFPVAALAAAWTYRRSRRCTCLAVAGLLFGLGLATKWSAAAQLLIALLAVMGDALRSKEPRERASELIFVAACLVVLPATVYLLTYLPWFQRGYELVDLLQFHGRMALETVTHTGYGNKLPGYLGEIVQPWRWFLAPVYYLEYALPRGSVGPDPGYIVGVANPLTWLLVWPACGLAAWTAALRRDEGLTWSVALFLVTYLPFAFATRPIWTNTALAVAPFALALVAWAAVQLAKRWRTSVLAWGCVAALLAAVLWPASMGFPSRVSDAVVRVLVPAEAWLPRQP
ncbi:MAG TPA: phospholipid carrier-dependent glycosyltransferase [Anaeromyxobacteraceae bacterium]|jgi:dolichyl-phosphate-mannose--protein O-mannosyl transferase|nr:phospholipid carrier-dependent glycosyltransferase [Anaeromyxobacteraceae bacterium]